MRHAAPDGRHRSIPTLNTTTQDNNSAGLGKIDLKLPRLSDIIGRHRADDTTPNSNTATSIVKRVSDAAKGFTDAIANEGDAGTTVVRATTNTGGSTLQDRLAVRTDRTVAQKSSPDTATEGGPAQTTNVVANQFA